MKPLISVIVPIYNVEKYLKECVDSILNQTYKNLEIILVDDGSPDDCGRICEEYAKKDGRIKVIHKENGGLSSARNAGLDICTGEYISFIDSDDYISEFFIEMMYAGACLNDSDVVTGTGAENFLYDSDERPKLAGSVKECMIEEIEPRKALEMMLYQNLPNGAQFRLYRRQIFDNIRFPIGYVFEDVATTHKTFIAAKRMAVVNAKIYAYRVRPDSIVRMKFTQQKMVVVNVTRSMFSEVCAAYPDLKTAASSRAFAQCYHVMLQVPFDDKEDMKRIWNELIKYRKAVVRDKNSQIRRKNKIGVMVSLFGMNISYLFGRAYLRLR
ncbi:MAG: glycosyltransferase family 2 protein [Agathobacter sp.]